VHVAGLRAEEPLLKAKCHGRKTEIVKLMGVVYKWVTKTQAADTLLQNNLLHLAAVT